MSTVVDNDKYIINGSTLSAIGDALRETGAFTRIVTETKYYKTDMTSGDERTVSASFFTGLSSTPTQAFIQVTRVDDPTNCDGITSPIKQKLSVGDQLILPLPFTYKGYVLYGSYWYDIGLNLYPLDAEGNFLVPENTTGYTAVTTEKKQTLPTLVQDIPQRILDLQGGGTPSFHAVINRLNQNPFNVCDYVSSWDDVLYYLVIHKSNWTAMVSGYFPVFTNASGVEIPQARKYLDVIGNNTSSSNNYNFYDSLGIVLDSTKPQGFRTIQQDGTTTGSSLNSALSADVKLQFLLYKE